MAAEGAGAALIACLQSRSGLHGYQCMYKHKRVCLWESTHNCLVLFGSIAVTQLPACGACLQCVQWSIR